MTWQYFGATGTQGHFFEKTKNPFLDIHIKQLVPPLKWESEYKITIRLFYVDNKIISLGRSHGR